VAHIVVMAVGSMEIKQVQKTVRNDAVAEQCRLKDIHSSSG